MGCWVLELNKVAKISDYQQALIINRKIKERIEKVIISPAIVQMYGKIMADLSRKSADPHLIILPADFFLLSLRGPSI